MFEVPGFDIIDVFNLFIFLCIRMACLYFSQANNILMISLLYKWQGFDGEEFLKCLRHLVHIEKEWVPYSNKCSLYIRPTLIGTQVSFIECSSFGSHLLTC